MLDGLLDLTGWQIAGVTFLMVQATIGAVTVYLHRHQAHRALDLHPAIAHVFRFWLWLSTGMGTQQWVAVHRKHHAKCETVDDPHSPRVYGIKMLLLQGVELYSAAWKQPGVIETYGYGTPDDWIERRVYGRYPNLGISLMLLTDVVLFGALGLTVWAVQMAWIPVWAAGVVNGLGHYWGYRNFETRDAATNLVPWGVFIGGEELHNNHHAYPESARLSNRWWEFDIGWCYIRVLALLGLAKVRRTAPRVLACGPGVGLDLATVQAVIRNRFDILANYRRQVLLPLLRNERKAATPEARRLIKQARQFLLREDLRTDERAAGAVEPVLRLSEAVATAYRFREDLRVLWSNATLGNDARLEALHDWCLRAEQTGIDTLRDFAIALRGYRLQPA